MVTVIVAEVVVVIIASVAVALSVSKTIVGLVVVVVSVLVTGPVGLLMKQEHALLTRPRLPAAALR